MSLTETETLRVERDGAVAILELNRPERLNAFSLQMGRELLEALREVASDPTIGSVVLTGAGRAFSAGADIKGEGMEAHPTTGRPDSRRALVEVFNPIVLALREMPQPVVAAVKGPAAGVACSFAMACDLVVAARSSYLLLAFVNIGLVPDGGATVLIPARAGIGRALEMALLGERVSAEDAHAWGLVNRVVDDEQLMPAALEMAHKLAAGPPQAHAAIKALFNAPHLDALREQLQREADFQGERSASDEAVEALTAFFEKRPGRYRD